MSYLTLKVVNKCPGVAKFFQKKNFKLDYKK